MTFVFYLKFFHVYFVFLQALKGRRGKFAYEHFEVPHRALLIKISVFLEVILPRLGIC
jgi:hypothetical protein